MELNDEFEVRLAPAEAWAVLTDVEKVVACVPGAELREVEGHEARGVAKVRVGPVTVSYRGEARVESLDAEAHKLVLKLDAREIRGQGNATALITATLSPSAKGTSIRIDTELSVTGKLAQFDRDQLAEASAKLVAEHARNLEASLSPASEEAPATADVAAPTGSTAVEADEAPSKAPHEELSVVSDRAEVGAETGNGKDHRWVEAPDEERESLIKRLAPYLTVAGFFLIARIVVYSLRRRRR